MFSDTEEAKSRHKLADKHVKDPQPGDYWHDMYSPVCVVLGACMGMVILCREKEAVEKGNWTWDLKRREAMTLADFKKWLSYEDIEGYWPTVEPEHHPWAVKCVEEMLQEEKKGATL